MNFRRCRHRHHLHRDTIATIFCFLLEEQSRAKNFSFHFISKYTSILSSQSNENRCGHTYYSECKCDFLLFQYSTISVYLCETDVESTTGLEAHTNKLHALSFVVFIAYRLFVSLQLHLSLLQTFGGMMMNWNGDVMEWYTALWNAQLKLISSKRDRENGANYFQGCFICTACE